MATAKKPEETTQEVATTTETKTPAKKVETVTYKVLKKKNFVGFMHPATRKFIKADKDGKFVIAKTDEKAIAILEDAADVHEV